MERHEHCHPARRPRSLRLECVRPTADTITLVVKAVLPHGHCPRCYKLSARVHSHYSRAVADLPWHGLAVKLQLHTRRFRCQNSLCTKRIFCERLPRVVAFNKRKTVRRTEALTTKGHRRRCRWPTASTC